MAMEAAILPAAWRCAAARASRREVSCASCLELSIAYERESCVRRAECLSKVISSTHLCQKRRTRSLLLVPSSERRMRPPSLSFASSVICVVWGTWI